MKKVAVDKKKCIGCGTCVTIAPKSFKLSDDGKAQSINPPGDAPKVVEEAVKSCPVEAIKLTD